MRNQKGLPVRQAGQVVLILILVMTTALAIGLSVIQRSLSDVSTSSKVEQSSRAFSAAEAGIEKALRGDSSGVNFPENNSQATVSDQGLLPAVPVTATLQGALGYPPLSKDEVAQVWLADPTADLPNCAAPKICYQQRTLDVYWGSTSAVDKAALELTLVYYAGGQYQSRKWYLDNESAGRTATNNFEPVACTGNYPSLTGYQCKKTLGNSLPLATNYPLPSSGLMLLRARLLYNTSSQPFAVQAVGTCGRNCSIPPQARIIISTGTAGATQRKVQVFTLGNVVPPFFDYGIFSVGDINK